MIDAVLFDFDGTLVNDVDLHARAWLTALEQEAGLSLSYLPVRRQYGLLGDRLLTALMPPEQLRTQGDAVERRARALYRETFFARARPFVMVRDLFERLDRAGVRRAVASAAALDETETGLSRAGVSGLVDVVVTREETASGTSLNRFALAAARLGLPAVKIVAVADSPGDLQEAAEAGVRTIGLLSGGYNAAELRGAGCAALYEDCADLLQRFGSWQPALRLVSTVPVSSTPPTARLPS